MAWTQTKRMSVQRYGVPGVLPLADSSIDVGDRAHVAGLFSADSFPAPPTPSATRAKIVSMGTRTMRTDSRMGMRQEAYA